MSTSTSELLRATAAFGLDGGGEVDYMVDEKIYCFWTGNNPITPNRLKGLETMHKNIGVHIEFLDKSGIEERILPEAPLHPAYRYLSCIHKSDYLRCYFMHHFGGGYADIKPYSKNNNWRQCFALINADRNIDVIGMHEVVNGSPYREYNTPVGREKLLGNGFFIARKKSEFTSLWYEELMRLMDRRLEDLKANPATDEFGGENYPLRWGEVQGEVFHKIIMSLYDRNPKKFRNVLRPGWKKGLAYR